MKLEEQLKDYPEVKEVVDLLHNSYATTKLKPTLPAIFYLPKVLAGHGNIPPWAVFHPYWMAKIVAWTLFPFEKETGFDREKGRTKIEKIKEVCKTKDDETGYVALVRTGLCATNHEFEQTIHAYIFNADKGKVYTKQKFDVQGNKDDTIFEVCYIWEHGEKYLRTSRMRFDYDYVSGLFNKTEVDLVLNHRMAGDLVFKVEKNLVDSLAKTRDLQISERNI